MDPKKPDHYRTRPLAPGTRITSKNGRVYLVGEDPGTLRRALPKERGKAARRADRQARREARSVA